jgi:hypothetical protein
LQYNPSNGLSSRGDIFVSNVFSDFDSIVPAASGLYFRSFFAYFYHLYLFQFLSSLSNR